ncbi:MAG: serine hydrolase [Pseudomonadota bacterium]
MSHYVRQDDRYRRWRPVDLSHRLAGGGWASTPSDLVRLAAGTLDDTFLPSNTRERLWTPQRLATGEVNEQDYAIGWRVRERDTPFGAVREVNHGGVSRGAQCWLALWPDEGVALALSINTNTAQFGDFAQISEALLTQFTQRARELRELN